MHGKDTKHGKVQLHPAEVEVVGQHLLPRLPCCLPKNVPHACPPWNEGLRHVHSSEAEAADHMLTRSTMLSMALCAVRIKGSPM